MKDYYYILGISNTATTDQIKVAYRKLATKFHPDKNDGDKFLAEHFIEIQEAYDTLSNPDMKGNYDYKLTNNARDYGKNNGGSYEEKIKKDFEDELKKRKQAFDAALIRKQKEYDEELKRREEEFKRKYQTPEQKAAEEEVKKREEEAQRKIREENKKREEEARRKQEYEKNLQQFNALNSKLKEKNLELNSLNSAIKNKEKEIDQIRMDIDTISYKFKDSHDGMFEPEMVTLTGGSFNMGSENGDLDEKHIHNVTVSSFKMAKYACTQAQWRAIMKTNPSHHKDDNCPVEKVSWNDAQEYIQKLNTLTGKKYRLPTEAEWEYAARGGSSNSNNIYAGGNDIETVAWYDGNSGYQTHLVGQKQPNEVGLYDMSGNVWEWCNDWYAANYYFPSQGLDINPQGPEIGEIRVIRGGCWSLPPKSCRIANRHYVRPTDNNFNIGFRLVYSL